MQSEMASSHTESAACLATDGEDEIDPAESPQSKPPPRKRARGNSARTQVRRTSTRSRSQNTATRRQEHGRNTPEPLFAAAKGKRKAVNVSSGDSDDGSRIPNEILVVQPPEPLIRILEQLALYSESAYQVWLHWLALLRKGGRKPKPLTTGDTTVPRWWMRVAEECNPKRTTLARSYSRDWSQSREGCGPPRSRSCLMLSAVAIGSPSAAAALPSPSVTLSLSVQPLSVAPPSPLQPTESLTPGASEAEDILQGSNAATMEKKGPASQKPQNSAPNLPWNVAVRAPALSARGSNAVDRLQDVPSSSIAPGIASLLLENYEQLICRTEKDGPFVHRDEGGNPLTSNIPKYVDLRPDTLPASLFQAVLETRESEILKEIPNLVTMGVLPLLENLSRNINKVTLRISDGLKDSLGAISTALASADISDEDCRRLVEILTAPLRKVVEMHGNAVFPTPNQTDASLATRLSDLTVLSLHIISMERTLGNPLTVDGVLDTAQDEPTPSIQGWLLPLEVQVKALEDANAAGLASPPAPTILNEQIQDCLNGFGLTQEWLVLLGRSETVRGSGERFGFPGVNWGGSM
ncbi:hypothetical protein C8Q80DRAFT_1121259 [Daedaleopsis nitida]|nr:hypothetical protein C8Q80DRAFT_1121259 [Daedaleopsis nitida]